MKFKYFFAGIFLLSIWLVECVEINYSPQDIMVDITNDFGICVLQLVSSRRENVAFSPYGLLSVALVMYEGASGPTAAEIHNTLRLPWNRDITRVGFRDMHRYLKSYFSNDGFLRGLVLSKPNVVLHRNYSRLLQFYGFDVNMEVDSTNYGSTTTSARPVLQDVPGHSQPPPTSSPFPSTAPPPTPSATITETTITTTTEPPTMITVPTTTPVPTEPPNLESAETTKTTEPPNLESAETTKATEPPVPPEPTLAASAKEDDITTTSSPPTTLVTTTTTVQPIINTQEVTTTEIPSNNEQEVTTTKIPSNNEQEVTTTEIPSNNEQEVTTTVVVQNIDAGTTAAESAELIQSTISTKSPSDEMMEGKEFEAIVELPNITEITGQTSNSRTETNNPELETSTQIGTTMQITEITPASPSAEGLVQLTTSSSLTSIELNAQPSTFNFVMTTLDRADLSSENPIKEGLEVTESLTSNDVITEINLDNQNKLSTIQTTFLMSTDHTETTFNQQNTILEGNTSIATTSRKELMNIKDSTILQNNKEIPTSTEISLNYEFIDENTQNSTIIGGPSPESIMLAPELTMESDITKFTPSLSNNTVSDDLDINTVNSAHKSEGTNLTDSITLSTSFLKDLEYKEKSVTETAEENVSNIRFDPNTTTSVNNTSVDEVTETNSVNMTEEKETSTVFNLFISEDNAVSNEKDKEKYAASILNETGNSSSSDAKAFIVVEDKNSSAFNITEESVATTMPELEMVTINLEITKNGKEISDNNIITERTAESLKNSTLFLKEGIVANIMSESVSPAFKDSSIGTEKNITIVNSLEESEAVTTNTYTSTNNNEISSTLFSLELSTETTSESFQPLLSTSEISSTQDQNSDNVIDKKETPLMNGRTKRSFDHGFEHREGWSNWVPHYQDLRWGYQPLNEHWFFTSDGGENVPVLSYTAFLPFAYIPEISSLALQLPLDDPRYSILILLPQERQGLSRMLYSLQWCSVRAITSSLKITAVYAVVPTFTIVKHINLVPALAQLGIVSLFDPFKSDLSAMSPEPNLFVRTIEQVVTVSVRKYYTSHRWYDTAPAEVEQHFIANHPFAYFVIDKETEVVLMSGTIVNPLSHNQQL